MISESNFLLKKNGESYCNCYCRHPELIENYGLAISDETQIWHCHHRKEELYSRKELIEKGEYYNRPPEELIFLTREEHRKLHNKGKKPSEETKKKISETLRGKKPANCKKVLCVETGEIFESTREAQRMTGIAQGNISAACNGKLKTTGGYHWEYIQPEI